MYTSERLNNDYRRLTDFGFCVGSLFYLNVRVCRCKLQISGLIQRVNMR